jgi:hypothetical protein
MKAESFNRATLQLTKQQENPSEGRNAEMHIHGAVRTAVMSCTTVYLSKQSFQELSLQDIPVFGSIKTQWEHCECIVNVERAKLKKHNTPDVTQQMYLESMFVICSGAPSGEQGSLPKSRLHHPDTCCQDQTLQTKPR